MKKFWIGLLIVGGFLWFTDAIAVIAGYHPSKLSIVVAFLMTSLSLFASAGKEWENL